MAEWVTQLLDGIVAAAITSLILGGLWMVKVILYRKEAKLQRRLAAVISETPYASKEYIDDMVLYTTTASLLVIAVLRIWGF